MYRKCKFCDGRGARGPDDCQECRANGFIFTPPKQPLKWIDDRWHCQGEGIHAGSGLELQGTDGEWFHVRIESADCGRKLIAFTSVHGHTFTRAIDPKIDEIRWPQ